MHRPGHITQMIACGNGAGELLVLAGCSGMEGETDSLSRTKVSTLKPKRRFSLSSVRAGRQIAGRGFHQKDFVHRYEEYFDSRKGM